MSAAGAGDAWLVIGEETALQLRPGRTFVARVVGSGGGRAVLSLAGSLLEVATTAPLAPGATVRLRVTTVDAGRVALQLVPGDEGPDEPDATGRPAPGEGGGIDRRA